VIEVVKGSLLDANEQYIAHQCNCVTTQGGGLYYYLTQRFPHADIYASRPINYRPKPGDDWPGNIKISGDGKDKRLVISMLAQFYPGKPKTDSLALDGYTARKTYFKICLSKISVLKGLESIAFPVGIGSGLAGGEWRDYQAMLEFFADAVKARSNVKVVLYDNDTFKP
jgi:O-acetyl-ADP-ribose deacetylase (regulator of RNase III)